MGGGAGGGGGKGPQRGKGNPTGDARFWPKGVGGALPARRRQAAPLSLQSLRAQGRQARRSGQRDFGDGRLQSQREQTGDSDGYWALRPVVESATGLRISRVLT